ncbi:MAG: (d)CMP kinase [Pseudomonadales bacterium]
MTNKTQHSDASDSPVIAIDGPVGSGKGVISHRLARHLGFHILDSGSLYRLIGLAARKQGISLDDEKALEGLARQLDVRFAPTDDPEDPLKVLLNQEDVSREIRTDQAGVDASQVAPMASVRDAIRDLQRSFIKPPGLIADGRDMGTIVFPDALLKIYLTASAEARARRRHKQLIDKEIGVSLHDLFQSIQARDDRDMNREVAPLRPAEDATVIDSTDMTIDEVFEQVLNAVTEKLG